MTRPLLYSFRRCPYAIRARLAIASAGIPVELREVVLQKKPDAFLQASPSGTVPCLVSAGEAIDESLDVMLWALSQHDPDGWLDMPDEGFERIAQNDGAFKAALDRTKYAGRYPGDPIQRNSVVSHRRSWRSSTSGSTAGSSAARPSPTTPYFRLSASSPLSTRPGSTAQPWPDLQLWLETFLASSRFECVMAKYEPWQAGDPPVVFFPVKCLGPCLHNDWRTPHSLSVLFVPVWVVDHRRLLRGRCFTSGDQPHMAVILPPRSNPAGSPVRPGF